MQPVLDSLPPEWETIIWNNRGPWVSGRGAFGGLIAEQERWQNAGSPGTSDLSVYGRYAAIKYASHDLIYVQDDDVIVSDPRAIVDEWLSTRQWEISTQHLVANMPQEFRHDGYTDSCLVGFGACFHREAPAKAFGRFFGTDTGYLLTRDQMHFNRCCDVVFTTLTPRVLVDIPKTDREMASDPNRMWKQPGHIEERTRMLDLARKVRDAS